MRRSIWILSILLLSVFVILSGCESGSASEGTQADDRSVDQVGEELPAGKGDQGDVANEPEKEPGPYTEEAWLIAVGDIMVHSPQITAAYSVTTATYSFDETFEEVAPILKSGDWVIGNFETTLAGPRYRYTGYPMFNSPDAIADALVNAGFNILGTANNHSYDRREDGVLRTLEQLRERNITTVGTHATPEEREIIPIVSKNGIDMALLAYTYGTNGIPLPESKPYLVNLIDEDLMKADIEKARAQDVDVVTVLLHYGDEYARKPSDYQKELARKLISWGADIILGSHTHLVQPYELVETVDESGETRQGVVIYSLGNFISNQGPEHKLPVYTDVGVIFKLQIKKHYPEEHIEFGVVETIPTWVHKYQGSSKRHYRILPLEETVSERNDKWLTDREYAMLDSYLEEMTKHLSSMATPVSEDGQN